VSYWVDLALGQGEPPRGPSLSHVKCMRWMGSRLNGHRAHDIFIWLLLHFQHSCRAHCWLRVLERMRCQALLTPMQCFYTGALRFNWGLYKGISCMIDRLSYFSERIVVMDWDKKYRTYSLTGILCTSEYASKESSPLFLREGWKRGLVLASRLSSLLK
jgi:hypothetical protein